MACSSACLPSRISAPSKQKPVLMYHCVPTILYTPQYRVSCSVEIAVIPNALREAELSVRSLKPDHLVWSLMILYTLDQVAYSLNLRHLIWKSKRILVLRIILSWKTHELMDLKLSVWCWEHTKKTQYNTNWCNYLILLTYVVGGNLNALPWLWAALN